VPCFRRPACHSPFFFRCLVGGGIVLSEALAASGLDPDWWQIVARSGEFHVYGGIFYAGLRWGTQARYDKKRCLQRLNLLKPIAGIW
jgi:hypothetical protein